MDRPSKKQIKAALEQLKGSANSSQPGKGQNTGGDNSQQHVSGSKAAKGRIRQKSV